MSRKGLTLVDVALLIAVVLIILVGTTLGYSAVKDNATHMAKRQEMAQKLVISGDSDKYKIVLAGTGIVNKDETIFDISTAIINNESEGFEFIDSINANEFSAYLVFRKIGNIEKKIDRFSK